MNRVKLVYANACYLLALAIAIRFYIRFTLKVCFGVSHRSSQPLRRGSKRYSVGGTPAATSHARSRRQTTWPLCPDSVCSTVSPRLTIPWLVFITRFMLDQLAYEPLHSFETHYRSLDGEVRKFEEDIARTRNPDAKTAEHHVAVLQSQPLRLALGVNA